MDMTLGTADFCRDTWVLPFGIWAHSVASEQIQRILSMSAAMMIIGGGIPCVSTSKSEQDYFFSCPFRTWQWRGALWARSVGTDPLYPLWRPGLTMKPQNQLQIKGWIHELTSAAPLVQNSCKFGCYAAVTSPSFYGLVALPLKAFFKWLEIDA